MKRFFLLVGALFLLASCTTELDQQINGSRSDKARQTTVFQASTEVATAPETKVYADEDMKVLWNADDRISIFNLTTYNYQFAFTGDDGDTAGGFELIPDSGFITGTNVDYVYAAYPYSKTNKLSNQGVFTMVLPAEQSYKEHSFGIGANTMVAVTDGNFLAFKNVGGYLSLRLYGDNVSVSRITIKGNNGEKIAGKASIDIPFGGTPTVTMDGTATDEVSIVCDPAVKIGKDANSYTDFWFVIPPVTFSKGFTITVTDDKGGVFEKATSKNFTVSRNTLDWMSALKVVPNYDNVLIQFEDANFKAYCVENFDRNNDGEISGAEAKLVTTMTVNPEIVASLKGIEYFKNLESLSCCLQFGGASSSSTGHRFYRNGEEVFSLLTSLDLTSNTALTYLDCSANSLTSLDVSDNTALTYLNCRFNQLTSLDVRKNSALANLYCRENLLTSLDVSKNTELTDLECTFNQLTNLDVRNNTVLTNLNCNSNQLTSLDVSKNTALTYLYCSYNPLTSLDVSKNTALTDLRCSSNQLMSLDVSKNTALTVLNCSSNQLTSLDVSNNEVLKELYCGSNQLTSLDVSINTALTDLDCGSNPIKSLNVTHNTALTDLHCNSNQLTSLDVSNNTALIRLYCHTNQLTSLDVSNNTALTVLHCYSNQLTNLDVSNNTALTYLNCRSNQLTSLDVNLCAALTFLRCESNQLTSLDVSNNTELTTLWCNSNPSLTEIWLKTGQAIDSFNYDTSVATIRYKN